MSSRQHVRVRPPARDVETRNVAREVEITAGQRVGRVVKRLVGGAWRRFRADQARWCSVCGHRVSRRHDDRLPGEEWAHARCLARRARQDAQSARDAAPVETRRAARCDECDGWLSHEQTRAGVTTHPGCVDRLRRQAAQAAQPGAGDRVTELTDPYEEAADDD